MNFCTHVDFYKGVFELKDLPNTPFPEIAFAGRSNVGKSSLLNALFNKDLAKVSSTPGHTRSINFYLVDKKYFFVDLPGYGFAKVPQKIKLSWGDLIENYLSNRKKLHAVVVIFDVRRELDDLDYSLLNFLTLKKKDIIVVINKVDKISKNELSQRLDYYQQNLIYTFKAIIPSSTKQKLGIYDLKRFLFEYLNSISNF